MIKIKRPRYRANQYNDGITYAATPKIKFIDRIRILFGAKIVFETEIRTQHVIGLFALSDKFFVETLRGKFFPVKPKTADSKPSL